MFLIVTGALAGLFHVLSGPDHLAAVAPIAMAEQRRGWLAGWTWGVGHASGVAVVAVIAVLLKDQLPPVAWISAVGERLVGVALIVARGRSSQHPLPLGTFLGLAGVVVLFVGQPLVDWYGQLLRG